eukprot:2821404-Rhodomonas_salina.1
MMLCVLAVLLGTPWLNVFYMLLGARVSLSARIDSFLRDPALISLGPRAAVKGSLYARAFVPGGLHFGRLSVGEG